MLEVMHHVPETERGFCPDYDDDDEDTDASTSDLTSEEYVEYEKGIEEEKKWSRAVSGR
jgi:hypothetical protein